MDEYLGMIRLFAGTYAPVGWLMCDGQSYSINEYTALFAICSFTYGGDGKSNFCVPDLRGRIPIGMGQGSGLSNYNLGEKGGIEIASITMANMPQHNHAISGNVTLPVNDAPALVDSPAGAYLAQPNTNAYFAGGGLGDKSGDLKVNLSLGDTGSGASFDINPPSLALNYIICCEGLYPVRPD